MTKLGTTFSHRQILHLGGNINQSLQNLLDLNLDLIRLGLYWSEIEVQPGEYNWQIPDQQIKACLETNQNLILTVGAKAPRWPEFYWPDHHAPTLENTQTRAALNHFISAAITRYQKYANLKYWQVENEPLDPVWPTKQSITPEDLQQTVELVRHLDHRPIILTAWANNLIKDNKIPVLNQLADIVGTGPPSYSKLKKYLNQTLTKPLWIAELQAEPWEASDQKYQAREANSISPKKLTQNHQKVQTLEPEAILLWGYEYWEYQAKQYNNPEYLQAVKNLTK